MLEEKHIAIAKTARYYKLTSPNVGPVAVLYVLHGYRQLAKYFIQQFQVLADLGVIVIAPEGLHRFYVEGYSGRVGASWMTKEDRETDILDYVSYLNGLNESLAELKELPTHVLGFSQGGATACRWVAESGISLKSLTLYASIFPNDFDFVGNKHRMSQIQTVIAFGDDDQFASEATIKAKLEWLVSKGVHAEIIRFIGGHEISDAVLNQIWKQVSGN